MRGKFPSLAISIMGVAFILMTAARSDASFIAAICDDFTCDGFGDFKVTDGGPGDTNLAPGIIEFVVTNFGGFRIITVTASSKPARTEPSMGLDFSAFDSSQPDSAEVWLAATDTDFMTVAPLSGHLFGTSTSSGSILGAIGGGINNDEFPFGGTLITPPMSFGGDFNTFDATVLHPPATLDLYSMLIAVRIRTDFFGPPGLTDGEFQVGPVSTPPPPPSTVPEPTSLMLLATGLAGALTRRRRSRAD